MTQPTQLVQGVDELAQAVRRLVDATVRTTTDAATLRELTQSRFNLTLGGGLGPLNGRVFRVGHMGDLNEPMMLGALATLELAFKTAKIPHNPGGVDAAMKSLLDA